MKIHILEFYYFCVDRQVVTKAKIMAESVEEIKKIFYQKVDEYSVYRGLEKTEYWERIKNQPYEVELPYFEEEESNQ